MEQLMLESVLLVVKFKWMFFGFFPIKLEVFLNIIPPWGAGVGGAWSAQSEEHATLDLGVMSSSPMVGVEITKNK